MLKLSDLIDLFKQANKTPRYKNMSTPKGKHDASKKGYKHIVNPSHKPSKQPMNKKQYRLEQKAIKQAKLDSVKITKSIE